MTTELENWARAERQAIREELGWLKAGGKLLSPSGQDITANKIVQLEARIEHASQAIGGLPSA